MEITKQTYSEVYAILNLMSLTMLNQIPEEIMKNIDDKRDKDMNIEISDVASYKVSEPANKLLAVLYKNYFATDEEKAVIIAKEKSIYEKKQKELYEKYNPDNLFKQRKRSHENIKITESVALIEAKDSLLTKIINKIKEIFKR